MNGTTMGLRVSSLYLYIQIAIDCCLELMPAHIITPLPPWGTFYTTLTLATLAHTPPYELSAICPVQLKPGFIHEEHISPACQWPSKVSICPLTSVTMLTAVRSRP
jgi:hypothetical protein